MGQIQKILWASLLTKLLIGALLPLFPDEAYYWVWSHHPQWSYYDHPPMVAWWLWLGQPLERAGGMVRWPAIALGHLTAVFWLLALRSFLPTAALVWFVALFSLSPLTGPGSVVITPDLPLMFFWAVATWALVQLEQRRQARWAFAVGLAAGLGFLSKYVMVIFVPLAVLWLLVRQVEFKKLMTWTGCAGVGFVLGALPVIWWNYQNNWMSFTFQLQHGLGEKSPYSPEWTFSYVGGELLLIFPTVLWVAFRQKFNRQTALMWIMGLGPLLFFIVTSFRGRVQLNWPIVAVPAVLGLTSLGARQGQVLRGLQITLALWALVVTVAVTDAVFQWVPGVPSSFKTREGDEWNDLAHKLEHIDGVYARNYQMAAILNFRLHRPIYKLKGMNRLDFYDFRPESVPPLGQRFYLVADPSEHLPAEYRDLFTEGKRRALTLDYGLLEAVPKAP